MTSGSLFHEIHRSDLHSRLRNPEASFLLACWDMARESQELPDEAAFLKQCIAPTYANLMILRRVDQDDWLYEHYGENIARYAGFDMTGERISAFKGALGEFFRRIYDISVAERRPLMTLHRYGFYKERPMWERLVLPVTIDGSITALYVLNRVRELGHDVTMLKVKSRDSGMIALQFRRDDTGNVVDALIIGANRTALDKTGRRLDQIMDRSMGECFPGIFEAGLWERYLTVGSVREPQDFELNYATDGIAGSFDVTIAPFHDGVTIEFATATDAATVRSHPAPDAMRHPA